MELFKFSQINILKIVLLFWLIAKIVGFKMYGWQHSFPMVPVHESLLYIANLATPFLYASSCFFLIVAFICPQQKKCLLGCIIIEILSCFLDQNRWQPWLYQYLFMAFIFYCNNNKKRFTSIIIFLLVATYFYSGLQKFNSNFLHATWDKLFLKGFLHIPNYYIKNKIIYNLGYLLPFFETVAGIGLCFGATSKYAAKFLIGMHLLTLLMIGPLGANYNCIIWPWNVAMIVFLYMIFIESETQKVDFRHLFSIKSWYVIALWGIAPAFNFWGMWDFYLSMSLYSGRLPSMHCCIVGEVPLPLQPFVNTKNKKDACSGASFLGIQNWAMAETNVPPYPEIRVYKNIMKQFEKKYPNVNVSFYITEK
jgi:uncharacterized membrane protein YphA (DoxX/SURF4 family)